MSDFISNRLKGYRDRAGQPFGDDGQIGKEKPAGRPEQSGPGRGGDDHFDDEEGGDGDVPSNHETKTWQSAPTEEVHDVKIPTVESRVERILDFIDAVPPIGVRPVGWPELSEDLRRVVTEILQSFRAKGGLTVFQDSTLAVIEEQIEELRRLEG